MSATSTVKYPDPSTPPLNAKGVSGICNLCGHNCGLQFDVEGGTIAKVRGDEKNPRTQGYICNKAFSIPKYIDNAQRLSHPLRRKPDGSFERIPWDTAIAEIAAKLTQLRDTYSPRSVAVFGLGGQANHMCSTYLTSMLHQIGSERWFCAWAQEKSQHNLVDQWMFDSPPMTMLHVDKTRAKYIVMIGTNPRVSNVGTRPTDSYKHFEQDDETTMVVIDPRSTDMTKHADRHVQLKPGSDVHFLLGMAAVLVREGLVDTSFIEQRTQDYEALKDALAEIDVEEMSRRCEIPVDDIVLTAREFAAADGAGFVYDLGVEQSWFSTLTSYLIRAMVTITGNLGRLGGNMFFETPIPPTRNLNRFDEPPRAVVSGIQGIRALSDSHMYSYSLVPEEIMADHPERIRGLIVENGNPWLSAADTNRWDEAREMLDLLVVVDVAMSESARKADYVLPAAASQEKWEFSAFARRYPEVDLQLRPPVIPPKDESLPEAEIYARIADAMGLFGDAPRALRDLAPNALTPEGAAEFMLTAQGLVAEYGEPSPLPRLLFWTYRTVGEHLPCRSLSLPWVLAHLNAIIRGEDIARAFGPEWADKDPFALGNEVFARMMKHPEGFILAEVDPSKGLDRNIGWEDGRVRLAPKPMIDEIQRAKDSPPQDDPDFPFLLAGGTRSHWTANVLQRDPSWRKGRGPHCTVSVNSDDADRLELATGDIVNVSSRRGTVQLPVFVDPKMRKGHVSIPNGFGSQYPADGTPEGELVTTGVSINILTDAQDRDPFTGCPHHKQVRCRIEKVTAGAA